jgi:hypothetical protein
MENDEIKNEKLLTILRNNLKKANHYENYCNEIKYNSHDDKVEICIQKSRIYVTEFVQQPNKIFGFTFGTRTVEKGHFEPTTRLYAWLDDVFYDTEIDGEIFPKFLADFKKLEEEKFNKKLNKVYEKKQLPQG